MDHKGELKFGAEFWCRKFSQLTDIGDFIEIIETSSIHEEDK